jgi:hypothetical protein
MGWKSTITLSRQEALGILASISFDDLTNERLAQIVEEVMGGDDHGHNYMVLDQYTPEKEE